MIPRSGPPPAVYLGIVVKAQMIYDLEAILIIGEASKLTSGTGTIAVLLDTLYYSRRVVSGSDACWYCTSRESGGKVV